MNFKEKLLRRFKKSQSKRITNVFRWANRYKMGERQYFPWAKQKTLKEMLHDY